MNRKNLLTRIGEAIDQYQTEHEQNRSEDQAPHQPARRHRWAARLLPNPGTVIFTVLVIAALLWAQSAGALPLAAPAAASTGTIAYQGRLADASGSPITNTVNMIFRLYAAASGGAPLWEEQWSGANSVQVSDGLFNVMLGSLTPIPQAVVTGNPSLFLGVTVGTDSEMSPRVQLGSVPFAVQALTVPDGSITTAKLADGAVTGAKLANTVSAFVQQAGPGSTAIYNIPFGQCGFVNEYTAQVTLARKSLVIIYFDARVHEDDGDWYFGIVRGQPPDPVQGIPLTSLYSAGATNMNVSRYGAEILSPGTYTYGVCVHGTQNLQMYAGGFTIYAVPTDM